MIVLIKMQLAQKHCYKKNEASFVNTPSNTNSHPYTIQTKLTLKISKTPKITNLGLSWVYVGRFRILISWLSDKSVSRNAWCTETDSLFSMCYAITHTNDPWYVYLQQKFTLLWRLLTSEITLYDKHLSQLLVKVIVINSTQGNSQMLALSREKERVLPSSL